MTRDYEDEIARWAEKLFYPVSLKGKIPKKDTTSKKLGATTAKAFTSHARIRAQIERTTRRTPEVMVKITNRLGAGKGIAAIREHLAYISRNSKLELETDTGELISDKAAREACTREWQQQVRGKPIAEVSPRREAFNIIMSMPAGTPPDKVREAASEFLKADFGGRHRYCFVLHTDTDKPHVHACVLAASLTKGKRLNPRKADLLRWREGFAQQLRELGIDANATPRRTRGSTQKPVTQAGHHVRKKISIIFREITYPVEFPKVYKGALDAWHRLARTLHRSDSELDRKAAVQIEEYIAGKKPEVTKKR